MKVTLLSTFLLAASALGTSVAPARSTNLWTHIGPFGGIVTAIAVSPIDEDLVLAAASACCGIYRSTDRGDTWSRISELGSLQATTVAFASDGTVYVGSVDDVWRSDDANEAWTHLSLGLSNVDTVREVAVDPMDSNSVWAGTSSSHGTISLMRSGNRGESWWDVSPPGTGPSHATGVTFDPNSAGTVYACFEDGSVWMSPDSGDSWSDRSNGIPDHPCREIVHDGTRLLLTGGSASGPLGMGLLASTDDGLTWSELHDSSWPVQLGVRVGRFANLAAKLPSSEFWHTTPSVRPTPWYPMVVRLFGQRGVDRTGTRF